MIKLIICFAIIFNSCFAQDTINLSQTHFKINECILDSSTFLFLDNLKSISMEKKYKLLYTEYVSPIASAHYASCRTKTLKRYLELKYGIEIIEIINQTITYDKRKKKVNKGSSKKEIPVSQEIFLILK